MTSETTQHSGHPVTMRDVAEAAGVSIATVSLVINDKKNARIGDDARRRVREAIRTLGYRPNALAKNLVSGHSKFIGLVADAIATTPFAGQIIHGAQDEAWKHGYVLLVANTDGNADAEREAIGMMLEHKVRGILYSTWYHRAAAVPEPLRETDFVLVDCFSPDGDAPAVVPDEVQGGRAATQLLIDSGHTRIAIINTTTPSPAHEGRLLGYREALEDAGIAFDPSLVFDALPEQEGGYDSVDALLASGATAVFCHNDRVAMGLYDGLRRRGLSIPEDMAVVGFDNQEVIAAHLRPPLTTVALPHYELGAKGVRMLLGVDDHRRDELVTVACPPVLRESIGEAHRVPTA
ncbi:transcriptional regulator, LacI family [Leifsonia sp. 98AMF]|uniref:LacI family DNA-binding transcriptional regulator n=1 Tax=unclassified Leifsonia TaxID=2663824 RepID=UPI00087ACE19|nr:MULTISPECIES: LacI family DNA-binding transcriptional regulator [unclassified Leifsonia]SDH21835.1 transcriptional regulator, LacI family [Leifsonia sp. 197AMF]SDJ16708.1 transcriptional regulator, LacI family [Leifsonia sp. 466MF]SDJ50753.1 transcriptional regulator, LacI family [Leifsonia sp. 157MF]SDN38177.1 transcriptional regulator, LacI family [Leifsonia sp. 509MF]SEM83064.1 transcriptional regulator, LacI family [Leifsonia sp. 467MF]